MSTTTNEKLKLGIIGCGWAAVNLHLPTLRRMPEYEVVAVADMNLDQAQTIGNRFEVRHRFREASELMAYPALDAVAICAPPGDHASLAVAAINAGKHVFIEKPLTLTLDQADRLVESVTRTDKRSSSVSICAGIGWSGRPRPCLTSTASAFLFLCGRSSLIVCCTTSVS